MSALREEFKNDLTVHIGLELEYDPKNFPRQFDFLKAHGIEYLILGQHALFGISDIAGDHITSSEEKYLDHHCGLQREAMDTGVITYVAHTDIYNFTASDAVLLFAAAKASRKEMTPSVSFTTSSSVVTVREAASLMERSAPTKVKS